jgi:hypothetical protein
MFTFDVSNAHFVADSLFAGLAFVFFGVFKPSGNFSAAFLADVFYKVFYRLFLFFVLGKITIYVNNPTLTAVFFVVILYRVIKAIPESVRLHNKVVNENQ